MFLTSGSFGKERKGICMKFLKVFLPVLFGLSLLSSSVMSRGVMLKITVTAKDGQDAEIFKALKGLEACMLKGSPGSLVYHFFQDEKNDHVFNLTEIYSTIEAFKNHLKLDAAQEPIRLLGANCAEVSCDCWGETDEESREMLKTFNTVYRDTTAGYILHPEADLNSDK